MVGHASTANARCTPATCASLGATCGTNIPDGCGGSIASCGALGGACAAGQVCTSGHVCCTPNTCAQIGAGCGSNLPDGCGGTIASCGTCTAPQTCGGGGTANVCGCSAKTCGQLGYNCGSGLSDTCGGTLSCGTCTAPQTCGGGGTANVCGCTPLTCASTGYNCGSNIADGCGGTISCGSCTLPNICQTNHTCGCTPRVCNSNNCGLMPDGCGNTVDCGQNCPATQGCGAGGVANLCGSMPPQPLSLPVNFAAGSLIIPMDECYNPVYTSNPTPNNNGTSCVAGPSYPCYAGYTGGDVRSPFGLLYLLAVNRIPVSIILNTIKTGLNDADMVVTPPAGSTTQSVSRLVRSGTSYNVQTNQITSGTNSIYLRGEPFVIEQAFADQALQVLGTWINNHAGLFDSVPLLVSNYAFTAPVLSVIGSRPKPILIDVSPLDTYFTETGIGNVITDGSAFMWLTGSGSSWSFNWPSAALGSNPGCPGDVCNALTYQDANGKWQRIVDLMWCATSAPNNWTSMPSFYNNGGSALVVAAGVAWEAKSGGGVGGGMFGATPGALTGPFCSTITTTTNNNVNSLPGGAAYGQYPASDPFLQLGDLSLFTHGSGGGEDGASSYNFAGPTGPAAGTHAITDGKEYPAIHGHPVVNGTQMPGNVIYLGSLNSWHGSSAGKDGGLKIMYDTLVAGDNDLGGGFFNITSAPFTSIDLSRTSPVAKHTGEYYLGTFDWKVPVNPNATGNLLWVPLVNQYPFVTGHFREYKSSANFNVANGAPYSLACSSVSAQSPCNWDAATMIQPWAQRNVYVVTGAAGSLTLTDAHTIVGDATIDFISKNVGTKLGGIDYATAAVIEGKPQGYVSVGNAKARPTIAYVGARDGMLHAFCVTPGPLQTSCYGFSPGQEIWAIIPKGVKATMDQALAATDWSQVNVGGASRVADIQDAFYGVTKEYRTIMVVGTRDSGDVIGLDISDPNPANLNSAASGFKYLWETHVGQNQGATLGKTASGNLVAAVTTAAAKAAGVTTTMLKITNGNVLGQVDTKLYSKQVPTNGGSSPMPNDIPAMPTVLDIDQNSTDQSIFVADFEGIVRKLTLVPSGVDAQLDLTKTAQVFDASAAICPNGITCQPIGVSPAIVRRLNGSNNFGVIVGTGGADWDTSLTNYSNVFGFDTATGSQFFSQALGTVTPPAPPGGVSVSRPLRIYSQLSVAGSDLYTIGTALSVGIVNQVLQPLLYPGTYGAAFRWGSVNSQVGPMQVLFSPNTAFAGTNASVIEINSNTTDGTVYITGTNGMVRYTLGSTSTSLSNKAYAINSSGGGGGPGSRGYAITSWFDATGMH